MILEKNSDQGEKKKRTYGREASTRSLGFERRLVHAQRMEGRRLTGRNRRRSSEVVLRSDVAGAGAVVVVSIVQTLRRE